MRYVLIKIRSFLFPVVSFLFLIFAATLCISQVAKAIDTGPPKIDTGYFYGYPIVLNSSGKGSYVLSQGIPSDIDTKSTFIDHIKKLRDGTAGDGSGDIIGASYIIQTMRGPDSNGNWDHSIPDAEDIKDWEDRINDPEIQIQPAQDYTYTINTRRDRDGISPNRHDVSMYYPSDGQSTERSFVFYRNGVVQYAIKLSCGNPLGSLPGLPPIPKNWSLTPYVSLNPTNYIEAGSSFKIKSAYVNNNGEVASGNVVYNLEKKVGAGSYSTYSTYSGTRTFSLGDTYIINNQDFLDSTDYDAGTEICLRLSVTPRSNTDSRTLSNEDCLIIGKKPKVQIWGSDLVARGNITTSASTKGGKIYGSWSEYALFAGGTITGIASGSAFNGGLASTLINTCSYSSLTFSNTVASSATTCNNGDVRGKYDTVSKLIPDVSASFPTSSAIGTVDGTITLGGLESGVYKSGSGDITINGSVLPSNKWLVLNVSDKNVTINGDISYTPNTLHKLEDIPQLVIIAKNIVINSNVTNVDAWLIANSKTTEDGSIKTCDIIGNTANKCNQRLTINGPVMTDKLYLYRTAGSGAGAANSGDPAEIINLRADAYLWAYNRVSSRGKIQTVYTKELPPRF